MDKMDGMDGSVLSTLFSVLSPQHSALSPIL